MTSECHRQKYMVLMVNLCKYIQFCIHLLYLPMKMIITIYRYNNIKFFQNLGIFEGNV
jgi:hypothetical protein